MSTAEGRRYVRTERFASLKDHVLYVVGQHHRHGATVAECVRYVNEQTPDSFKTYSNPVSGALSRLHNVDLKIIRLKDKRGGFDIYVLPEYVNGRDYHLPRPPDGREGDRLTPALVLEVLDGIARLGSDRDTLRTIWINAKAGDVSGLQRAVDIVRGREVR